MIKLSNVAGSYFLRSVGGKAVFFFRLLVDKQTDGIATKLESFDGFTGYPISV